MRSQPHRFQWFKFLCVYLQGNAPAVNRITAVYIRFYCFLSSPVIHYHSCSASQHREHITGKIIFIGYVHINLVHFRIYLLHRKIGDHYLIFQGRGALRCFYHTFSNLYISQIVFGIQSNLLLMLFKIFQRKLFSKSSK